MQPKKEGVTQVIPFLLKVRPAGRDYWEVKFLYTPDEGKY
jgi:hypothetical protein